MMDQLKFMSRLVSKTEEDTIRTVNTGCNQPVKENSSAVRCKGWMKVINIAQMKICRLLMCSLKDNGLSKMTLSL